MMPPAARHRRCCLVRRRDCCRFEARHRRQKRVVPAETPHCSPWKRRYRNGKSSLTFSPQRPESIGMSASIVHATPAPPRTRRMTPSTIHSLSWWLVSPRETPAPLLEGRCCCRCYVSIEAVAAPARPVQTFSTPLLEQQQPPSPSMPSSGAKMPTWASRPVGCRLRQPRRRR